VRDELLHLQLLSANKAESSRELAGLWRANSFSKG
jgi:hypothetical protein